MSGRNSALLNYIVPSIFPGEDTEQDISRAATDFIQTSTLEMPSMDEDEHKSISEVPLSPSQGLDLDDNLKTVAGLVSEALVDLLRSPKVDYPWKSIAGIAQLLLRQGMNQGVSPAFLSEVLGSVSKEPLVDHIVPDDYCEGGRKEGLTRCMVVEMGRCTYQVTEDQAHLIRSLVLFLLQRLDAFPLQDVEHEARLKFSLVVISMIADSMMETRAGIYSEESLKVTSPNLLVDSYKEARSSLSSVV